jgi:hypothetical protein
MDHWREQFKFDPIPPLPSSDDEALQYFVRRDVLGERVGPVERLWCLPSAQRILRKQQADGSWPHHGVNKHPAINPRIIDTWRQLRLLVEQYGFTRENPQAERAAEYLFSCQTPEGDIRGILANQYATYYTGAIMATLIEAGYGDDPRVATALDWLLSMRQEDGGWSVPLITHKLDRAAQYRLVTEWAEPLQPDRSKPFSHNWTGMVLRAFALHPQHRGSAATRTAADLLKSRFFRPDVYTSYQAASYWVRFEYPLWWNNLVAALDSLSRIGLSRKDQQMALALSWLVDHQEESGLWRVSYAQTQEKRDETARARAMKPWIGLAICRIFKRLYS